MAMAAPTRMPTETLTLTQWLSPSFPVGAFAYSHGLETAIADGHVTDAATVQAWLADALHHGAGRNDAILLAAAYRTDDWQMVETLAIATTPSAERLTETTRLGTAFARTVTDITGHKIPSASYPVALGLAARAEGLSLSLTLTMSVQAFAANLISAAIRLVPLGQTEAQRILTTLAPDIADIAAEAETATLDDLGGAAIAAEIASMRHETQDVRLFTT